jgi:hypothetical protein
MESNYYKNYQKNHPTHKPEGDPCSKCGLPLENHRKVKPTHKPEGDPCSKCGLSAENHRVQKPRIYKKREYKKREYKKRDYKKSTYVKKEYISPDGKPYIGIDGEGRGRDDHKYILLAAAAEEGKKEWSISNPKGLSTIECLDFILSLPTGNRIFSFAFNYDLTKILTDLTDGCIYRLFRPEERQRYGEEAKAGPWPVLWNGYCLNLQGGKFTVRKQKRKIVIWDIFRFYNAKFVTALKNWKVGKEYLATITEMKEKRQAFDKESLEDITSYCLKECRYIAELVRKLVIAHEEAGLKLKNFYGAGSSAAAMLEKMGIREKIVPTNEEMVEPVASAFFGGRFENSVIGSFYGTIYNYDISSAYPYQLFFLPCLQHGKWKHTKRRKDLDDKNIRCFLVSYKLGKDPGITDWGPFPFRTVDGSICFPIEGGGGWVWGAEYIVAEKMFPHIQFIEAYLYECDCDCIPFKDIPHYYRERCRIGKDGAGIVLKLGPNSCYGKLAQSVGKGTFNNWIWAGLITSGTRAQLLEMVGLHNNRADVLMTATDGLYTKQKIIPPIPKNTDTWETKKPLGGWEEKIHNKGIFVARPGIYFPLNPTEDEVESIRGRGVGRKSILENWERIVEHWEKNHDVNAIVPINNVARFCGGKTSISRSGDFPYYSYKRANGKNSENSYGNWTVKQVEMSFNPMPKRDGISSDGKTLIIRKISRDLRSSLYKKAVKSEDAKLLEAFNDMISEQPDGSMIAEYENIE